jgi:glycosyltransferase involved in cell wall biosynthesis
MRIGMILHGDSGYPEDIRVTKESSALVQAGFEVHVLCQRQPDQIAYEVLASGVHVHRVKIERKDVVTSSARRKVQTLIRNLAIDRPRNDWRPAIKQFVKEARIDVLHCHDLPALPVACDVAHECSVPIVADLHENWPGFTITGIEELPVWKQLLRRRLYRHWKQLEKKFLPQCSRIVVVVEEAARRVSDSCRVRSDDLVVVSNTEDASTLVSGDEPFVDFFPGRWTATYVGGIGPHRGIDTSIRAAAIAGRKIPGFQLAVVGPSELQVPRLERLIYEAGASGYVTIIRKVPSAQVPAYIRSSEVCLVPHNDTEHTNTTVPHKLFQYMLLERPVLVSDCPPLERIVRAAGCGEVFRRNDADHMAEQLVKMHSDPQQLEAWAVQGARSASTDFSWGNDAIRLVEMYDSLGRAA